MSTFNVEVTCKWVDVDGTNTPAVFTLFSQSGPLGTWAEIALRGREVHSD